MLNQLLKEYNIKNDEDYFNALREVFQKITLAGLYRGKFFEKATFYGGTCLRIFYGLDRFSEDLDFSLLKKDSNFELSNYFHYIEEEFNSYGLDIIISQKKKINKSNIESAFLKTDTDIRIISLENDFINKKIGNRKIKIKFEVDVTPPLNFNTEEKLVLNPYSFYIKCFDIPSLFAGKLHAVLFRKWKNRVKGRDWYDFEWYMRNGFSINLSHLTTRAIESNDIGKNENITKKYLKKILLERINDIDFNNAKNDIKRFTNKNLDIWSKDYFKDIVSMI